MHYMTKSNISYFLETVWLDVYPILESQLQAIDWTLQSVNFEYCIVTVQDRYEYDLTASEIRDLYVRSTVRFRILLLEQPDSVVKQL